MKRNTLVTASAISTSPERAASLLAEGVDRAVVQRDGDGGEQTLVAGEAGYGQVLTWLRVEAQTVAIQLYAKLCVACHGADGLGTAIAPALNDPSVREKTPEELNRTITYGSPGTLMASWSGQLTPEQIESMVTLILHWDEIPAGTIPAPDVPIATTAESIARGSELFAANCSRCHGPEGQGTPRAPALNVKSFLTGTNDRAIELIITNGVPGTAMPAWGDRMSVADIQAIVGFIRQWEPTAPEVAVPTRPGGGGPPWLRNNTSGTGQPGTVQGHTTGGYPWLRSAKPAWWQTLNWPLLLGLTAFLSVAFTLIIAGYTALKDPRKG